MSFGIRTALLAAQSASSKVVDGIGRTLGLSDIGKLRPSKGQTKQDGLKLENLLSSTWKKLQDSSIGTSEKYKHFGRIAIRSVMFTLQKKTRDGHNWSSLEEIEKKFHDTLRADPSCYDDKVVQSNPSSTSKEDAKNAIVDLQQSQNPYFLALQSHGESTINVGSLVTYAVDGIYEVVKYEATGISMKQRTLFGTGEPFAVDLKDVGSIKIFKGVVPKLIDDGIVETCFPTVICTKEEEAAQIFVAMMELYNSQDTDTSCLHFSNAGEVYSKHKMSKGELTLVPCTDSTSKIVKIDPSEVGKLTKMSVGFVSMAGKVWKILPPKPLKEHGGDWKGVAVPFFMCKPASVGQMITKKITHKGYAFECITNHATINPHEKIAVYMEDETGGNRKKRRV